MKNDIFSSVGGNAEAKLALEDALALDSRKRSILSAFGMSPPSGVLLYGPPGTGKTLLARATAQLLQSTTSHAEWPNSDTGGAFISLRASDIVRSEIGSSEKVVVSAFEFARKNSPSVVFIDEFQALFTSRDGGSRGGGKGSGRLASTLLHCMDDVSRWRDTDVAAASNKNSADVLGTSDHKRIVVLGATNAPWMVDRAFLRPGRFDRVVHVGLPTLSERESILRVHMNKMKLNLGNDVVDLVMMVNKICAKMAKMCDGFSGADLAAVCRAAAVKCLNERGDASSSSSTSIIGVEERHFLDAIANDVTQSSSKDLVDRLLKWRP